MPYLRNSGWQALVGKKEEVYNAQAIGLMHKLISSTRDNDDLSFGFKKSFEAWERELTKSKSTKGKYLVKTCFKDIFGFAAHQQNTSYVLGYKSNF